MRLALPPGRLPHLDGLRGIAAIVVVLSHVAAGFVPALFFGSEGRDVPQWQATFATWPSFVMINGPFAVFIFFVLSGFVISASADAAKSAIYKNCIARLIRLSVPCAASILLAGGLLAIGFSWIADAARIVDHQWINWYTGDYGLFYILGEAAGSYYWTGGSSLNPPLWTMQRELLGSLVIYWAFGVIRHRPWRLCFCALVVPVLIICKLEAPLYLCFVAGALLFVLREKLSYFPSWSGLLMLFIGLIFGGRPFGEPPPESFYHIPFLIFGRHLYGWYGPIGATLIVTGTLVSSAAAKALGSKLCRFLGRISFSVYLVHFALLKSVMAYLFVSWGYRGGFGFVISASCYLFVVIGAGTIFTILVDEKAIYLSHLVRRFPSRWAMVSIPNSPA